MADQRQRSQWVVRSLRWYTPSVTSGTAYPHIAVVNSFPSQDGAMGQIQWAPARPHLPLISNHIQRKSLQFMRQEHHAPCTRNLGPNLFWFALTAKQWLSYDPLNVQRHHQGLCQLERFPGEDAAWWSGKGTPPPPAQMGRRCKT